MASPTRVIEPVTSTARFGAFVAPPKSSAPVQTPVRAAMSALVQLGLIAEEALKRNEVKALIATSALGMGFDKPDLGFVVHLGAPSSPVATRWRRRRRRRRP